MDLDTVQEVVSPRSRAELWPLDAQDALLAGGTWLFSEPQVHLRRLVDLTSLGWAPITFRDKAIGSALDPADDADSDGLELAATCTVAEVARLSETLPGTRPDWAAAPLFHECCTALLASVKIWRTATVGGNLCLSFAAGSMVSLAAALDGELEIWRPDGADYRVGIADFVIGAGRNVLASGDVLRSVFLPAKALRGRTAYRKLAPSPLGRSGIVVIGRRDAPADGAGFTLSITAATVRPFVFGFPTVPDADAVRAAHATIPDDAWTDDAHGDPDWRQAMALLLAQEVRTELT